MWTWETVYGVSKPENDPVSVSVEPSSVAETSPVASVTLANGASLLPESSAVYVASAPPPSTIEMPSPISAWLLHWYHNWSGALSGTVNVNVWVPVAKLPVTPSS